MTKIFDRDSSHDIEVTHKISASGAIVSSERLDFVRPYPPTHYAVKSPSWDLIVENRFSSDITGGKIGIKHGPGSMVGEDSPYSDRFTWGSFHTLNALLDKKNYGGGYWGLDQWIDASEFNEKNASSQISYQVQLIYGNTNHYIASYGQQFNVIIENYFKGLGNISTLIVNDTIRTMPFSIDVIIGESITISSPINSQTYNHIDYDFTVWSTGSEAHTITVTPESNMTVTAHYKGYPRSMTNYGISGGTIIGDNIKLTWNVHPNQNVSKYRIFREVKRKYGPWSQIILVGTVNRNTTSWEDPQYILTNGYSDDLLFYDVRPFYTIESTESKEDWTVTFGEEVQSEEFFKKRADGNFAIPDQYELTQNHPNPFNPVTTIRYGLPKDSKVKINIYNLKGQLVKTLVNQSKSAGYYTVNWNIKDNAREEIAAGIYLYQIVTPEFTNTKKLVVMK